jgi:hypothetical protein
LFVNRVSTSETSPIHAIVHLIPDGLKFIQLFIGERLALQSLIGVLVRLIRGQRRRPRDALIVDATPAQDLNKK